MATNSPLVSVVIPIYNRAELGLRALRSVQNQGYSNVEIIVVDDGSSDDLMNALSTFDEPRLQLIQHERNLGAAAARNTGIRASKGRYVAFLDSDDEWMPGKLEKQVRMLEGSDERIRVVTSSYVMCDQAEGSEEIRQIAHCSSLESVIWGCSLSPGSTMMACRSVFDMVGQFDEDLGRFEDWDWLIRYLRIGRISVAPEPLARIYIGTHPTYESVDRVTRLIWQKHKNTFRVVGLCAKQKFKSALTLERAVAAWRNSDNMRGIGLLVKSICMWPFRNAGFYRKLGSSLRILLVRSYPRVGLKADP